jgi:hypothetical protein
MKALEPPTLLTIYMLLKQDGLVFAPAPVIAPGPITSCGFFATREDAEMYRTHQTLLIPSTATTTYHVFELQVPNPL